MRAKKKLIISMLVVAFVLLSIIATVAIAFALTQQTIKTTLNIGYTVEDIDGTASATFTVGGVTENLTAMKGTQVIGDKLVFKAGDTEDAGNLMFPEDALALSAQNDNVVIQYTYSNTGAKHYIASMDFAANIEADNMKVEYSIDGTTYSEQRYAVVVPANTSNKSYWIKISIIDKAKSASFTGDFDWLLNSCDPQSADYLTLASTEFQAVEGQPGAYSVKLIGDGAYLPGDTIVFPSEVNGDVVTTIAASSLSDSEKTLIKSVQIPNSVTTIGDKAFENFTKLETFTIGETAGVSAQSATSNLKTIGKSAFYNCSSLINLELSNNLSVIDNGAFYSCASLNSITFPASLTNIGMEAFYNCTNLASATFAEDSQITTIGYYAFRSCTSLESFEIPASVTTINARVFYNCGALASVTFAEGSKLTSIGDLVFYGCSKLQSISIPEGVTIIGDRLFYGCTILQFVSIPASVTNIVSKAFYKCSNLKSIEFKNMYGWQYYNGSAWVDIEPVNLVSTLLSNFDKEFKIPLINPVTSVNYILSEDGTYYIVDGTNNNMKYYVIKAFHNGKPVKEIKTEAFKGRTDITSIYFEDGSQLKTIGAKAFDSCYSLTKLDIPASVKTIGERAFYVTGLTYVVIPENVTSIGKMAFHIPSLHTLVNKSDINIVLRAVDDDYSVVCQYVDMIFTSEVTWAEQTNVSTGVTYRIYRPKNGTHLTFDTLEGSGFSQATYKVAISVVDKTKSTYTFDEDTDGIGCDVFLDNLNLSYIIIPANVKSIGVSAFGGCFGLNVVSNLSDHLNLTGYAATTVEYGCLTYYLGKLYDHEVYINNIVINEIKYYDVYNSQSDADNETNRLDRIAYGYTAATAKEVTSIVFDSNTTVIAYNSFTGCAFEEVVIPASVRMIQYKSIVNNSSLKTVIFEEGSQLEYVGGGFYNCENLTSINLEVCTQLKHIGLNSFWKNPSLTTIIIPESVTEIDIYAFNENELLEIIFMDSENWYFAESKDAEVWTEVSAENLAEYIKSSEYENCYFKKID